ncbi:hypothetical protein PARA125_000444 [Parachlamydia sp. AcF125]|nr:hypothetical protein [Parachlamydia sp. AcF125]
MWEKKAEQTKNPVRLVVGMLILPHNYRIADGHTTHR